MTPAKGKLDKRRGLTARLGLKPPVMFTEGRLSENRTPPWPGPPQMTLPLSFLEVWLRMCRWYSFALWRGADFRLLRACNARDLVPEGGPKDKLCHSRERWDMPNLLLLSWPGKGSSSLLAVWAKNFGFTFDCSFLIPHYPILLAFQKDADSITFLHLHFYPLY